MSKNRLGNRWKSFVEFGDHAGSGSTPMRRKWETALLDRRKLLGGVAAQLMNGEEVLVEGQRIRVKRIGSGRLRMVQFKMDGRVLEAIEQNPEKPSRWGQLAREKHQVVQFLDVEKHRYVAVAVDGEVKEYGR